MDADLPLEPEANISRADTQTCALVSLAISMKRIADAMTNQQPVNAYGESFTDAIQNSFVRGQRGIATWGG
jgi:hypothetical protein